MGKPHSELLNGHVNWLGSYDECIAIVAKDYKSGKMTSPFIGQYCTAKFPLGRAVQAVHTFSFCYLSSFISLVSATNVGQIQSTLVISTSVISNNRLSRRENLTPVLT